MSHSRRGGGESKARPSRNISTLRARDDRASFPLPAFSFHAVARHNMRMVSLL